jgi:crotonobetainyl-CoA:carnitine CoA-transferase CaiB-like acyl-CoA transferase
MPNAALDGLKILELGEDAAGAYCAKLLADLGAEVIKVEQPAHGDPARSLPPFAGDIAGPDRSGVFLYLNSNKLGITLDIEHPSGRTILFDLLASSDVLIETLGPARATALQLDYKRLGQQFPELVVTSISPYGQSGRHSNWKGGELTIWNASGYAVLTPAGAHGEEEPPLHTQSAQVASLSGANAAGATMAALLDRDLYGEGQQVDISEQETMIAALAPQLADHFYEGNVVWSRTHPRLNTMKFLPCKDGYVSLLLTQPDQWDRMQEWMGNPEWLSSIEYRGTQGMTQNWDVISFMLSEWFSDKNKEEIFREGQARHIPIGPVNSIAEALESPQIREREFMATVRHPVAGEVELPGAPYRFSETPWRLLRPAPGLGEHNQTIYQTRLGYGREQVEELYETGII